MKPFRLDRRFASPLAAFLFAAGLLPAQPAAPGAREQTTPYPPFLVNSYLGAQLGYIDYRFSSAQMQPGFHARSIWIPHLAARVVLFGHEFNKYVSAQITDMRPVQWVYYRDVNGDLGPHSVWMNIAGLTGKARLPLTGRWSVYGEAGLGLVTRKGFAVGAATVVRDAAYATLLSGAGLEYRVSGHWNLLAGVTVAPGHSSVGQPRTLFYSSGFTYAIRSLPAAHGEAASSAGQVWPKNVIELGYATNAPGYGVNNFVSKGAVPVFWSGSVDVADGVSANYRRNVFHTRRFFALDWGAGVSSWKSRKRGERFYTTSMYPVFRFSVVRTNPLEFHLSYSLAGPTWITRTTIDNWQTGKRFTFQDFMGAGVFLGRNRRVSAEVRIAHYSNGNLFPQNPGVTIPLGFYLGAAF